MAKSYRYTVLGTLERAVQRSQKVHIGQCHLFTRWVVRVNYTPAKGYSDTYCTGLPRMPWTVSLCTARSCLDILAKGCCVEHENHSGDGAVQRVPSVNGIMKKYRNHPVQQWREMHARKGRVVILQRAAAKRM